MAAPMLGQDWKEELRRIIREEIRAALHEMHEMHAEHEREHGDDDEDEGEGMGLRGGGRTLVWHGALPMRGWVSTPAPMRTGRAFTFSVPAQPRAQRMRTPPPQPAPEPQRARARVRAPQPQAAPQPPKPPQPIRVLRTEKTEKKLVEKKAEPMRRQVEVKQPVQRRIMLRSGDGKEPRIMELDGKDVMIVVEPPGFEVDVDVEAIQDKVRAHLKDALKNVPKHDVRVEIDTKQKDKAAVKRRSPGVMV